MVDLNILKQKTKSEGLEYIYKEIGDYILLKGVTAERKYKDIDKFISEFISNDTFNFHFYVGILTATIRFKHKLRNRKQLWQKTIEMAKDDNILSNEQIKNTLNNLE